MMNITILNRIWLLFGLITIITLTLFFSGCTEREITVVTDKLEYKQGETITVTIKNNLKEVVFLHTKNNEPGFCIWSIERKTIEKQWEPLFTYVPSCAFDMDLSQKTEPGQSEILTWSQSMNNYPYQLDPGKYRLSVLYENNDTTEFDYVYSNAFTIK